MSWVSYWGKPGFDMTFWEKSIAYYCDNCKKITQWKKGKSVLDYGAGPGFTGAHFLSEADFMVFVEPSEALLSQCRTRNEGLGKNTLFSTDISSEGIETLFAQGKVDLILLNSVLQYVPKNESSALLARLVDGLSENGCLVVSDLIPEKHSLTSDLRTVGKFYLRWFSVWHFFVYFLAELRRFGSRRGMEFQTFTKESFEKMLDNNVKREWVQNPTVCSSRMCCVLRKKNQG